MKVPKSDFKAKFLNYMQIQNEIMINIGVYACIQ